MTELQKWAAGTPAPGPRQVADFDKAWRHLVSWEARTFVELTGTVGDPASEHRSTLTQLFTGGLRDDVTAAAAAIGEAHDWTLTKDSVRAITAEVSEASKAAEGRRPVHDERISADERAERDAMMAHRHAAELERSSAAQAAWSAIKAKAPASAAAVILAELNEDTSDIMTDYFSNRTVRMVAIGWRYGKREDFRQLRAAAAGFAETRHLDAAEHEHRDNYSMGKGNYLGTGNSGSGWTVRSYGLEQRVGEPIEDALPETPTAPAAAEGIAGAAGVTIRPGRRPGVLEVVFAAKPAEEVRTELKSRGFRWARSNGCWYGPAECLPDYLSDPNSNEPAEPEQRRGWTPGTTGTFYGATSAPQGHAPDIDLVNGY